MTGDEIKRAIECLPTGEAGMLLSWLEEYVAERWERDIKADAHSGRFEAAGQRAEADHEAGRTTPL